MIENIDNDVDENDVNDAMSEASTVPFPNDTSSPPIYTPTTPFYQFIMPKPFLEFVRSSPPLPQSSTTLEVESEQQTCPNMMQMLQIILKQQLIINESIDGNILTVRMTRYDFNQYREYLQNK